MKTLIFCSIVVIVSSGFLWKTGLQQVLVPERSFRNRNEDNNTWSIWVSKSIAQLPEYVTLTDGGTWQKNDTQEAAFWLTQPFRSILFTTVRAKIKFDPPGVDPGADGMGIFIVTPTTALHPPGDKSVYGVEEKQFEGIGFFFNPSINSIYVISSDQKQQGQLFKASESLDKSCLNNVTDMRTLLDVEIVITNETMTLSVVINGGNNITCVNNVPLPNILKNTNQLLTFGVGARCFLGCDTMKVESLLYYNTSQPSETTSTSTSTTTTTTSTAAMATTTVTTPTVATTTITVTTPTVAMTTGAATTTADTVARDAAGIQDLFSPLPDERQRVAVEKIADTCDDFDPTRAAPPNNGEPNTIVTAFSFERLNDIDDVRQELDVYGILFLHWKVTTCSAESQFKYSNIPPGRLFVPQHSDVWIPSLQFISGVDDIFMNSLQFGDDLVALQRKTSQSVNLTLEFYWTRSGIYRTVCGLNLEKFPFDKQRCVFSFAFSRARDLVQYDRPYVFCPTPDSGVWAVDGCEVGVVTKTLKSNGNKVDMAEFTIKLARLSTYYVVNLVLPTMALSFLVLVSFVLPPSTSAERPAFTITILLALTVAQTDVNANVPKTSQRIWLPLYVLLMTYFSVGCTLYHMLTCWLLYFRGDKDLMAPRSNCCYKTRLSCVGLMDGLALFVATAFFIGIHVYAVIVISS